MDIYEALINTIDKNGKLTTLQITEQINQAYSPSTPVLQSSVESIINDNKDLLLVKEGIVVINPDKIPHSLKVSISGYPGPCLRVNIDFKRNRFTFFEWYYTAKSTSPAHTSFIPGSVENFKLQLYKLKLWDWEEDYQLDGIILDGICWSIKLETPKKVYEKEGLQSFPVNWKEFCHSISKLTGKPIVEMLPR